MPTFEIQKGGKTYEIEVPNEGALEEAIKSIPDEGIPPSLAAEAGKRASEADFPKQLWYGVGDLGANIADIATKVPLATYRQFQEPKGGVAPKNLPLGPSYFDQWQQYTGQPKDLKGDIARTVGQSAPLGLLGPTGGEAGILSNIGRLATGAARAPISNIAANAGARMAVYGAEPALMGRAAGAATQAIAPNAKVQNISPWDLGPLGQVPLATAAAMAVTGRGPGSSFLRRKITPFTQTSPMRAQAAETIRQETGQPPSVGNIFNNQAQKNREIWENPEINNQMADRLTRAYTSRVDPDNPIGMVSSGLGQWFDSQLSRIGGNINRLSNHTFINPRIPSPIPGHINTQIYDDLADLSRQARSTGNQHYVDNALRLFRDVDPNYVPTAGYPQFPTSADERMHDALFRTSPSAPGGRFGAVPMQGNNSMSAIQFQRLRNTLTAQADGLAEIDPGMSSFYRSIVDSLDNASQHTHMAAGTQPIADEWQRAHSQLRALQTVQHAARNQPAGSFYLDPDTMKRSDIAINGQAAYNRGETPFADLTNAAGNVGRPINQANIPTAPGMLERNFPWLYSQGPRLAGLVAGGASRLAGGSFAEPFIAGIIGAAEGRWSPSGPPRKGTVGSGPWAQAYGRNQILPFRRDEDVWPLRAQQIGRALMTPQAQMYGQPQQ